MLNKEERPSSTIAVIKALLPSFNASLRKVGRYILENQQAVIRQSIDELSEATQVSKASVVRFCKALGYSGYREFKLKYIQDIARDMEPAAELSKEMSRLKAAFDDQVEAIHHTWEILDPAEFERAVALMLSARQLTWFGVGASGYLAQWINHKAGLIGLNSRGVDSIELFLASIARFETEDVIVCLSHTGRTPSIIECIRRAKPTGAKVIVVTNNAQSPLAGLGDVKLITADHEFHLGEQVVSFRPAHEAVANALLGEMIYRRDAT